MGAELFYVLVGSVAVAAFARWRGWPAPLLVTAVALVVSLLPFVPEIEVDGHLLLNLTLPPLLYSAALESSFLSFRYSLPHIRRLGVGLVLVTAIAVGLVAWLIMPELGLAGALLLGAIVGPPDAVSAEHAMPAGHIEVLVAVAFVVTVGTLLLQGLTLTPLIRALGVTADEERRSDQAEIARMRRLSNEAGLEYLRAQQQRWIAEHGEESVDVFKGFARAMVRVERDTDRTDRDLEKAQERWHRVPREALVDVSKGWLAVRRQVLLDECRAGNLSEEVMRELFVAMDAEELALDTRGALRDD